MTFRDGASFEAERMEQATLTGGKTNRQTVRRPVNIGCSAGSNRQVNRQDPAGKCQEGTQGNRA